MPANAGNRLKRLEANSEKVREQIALNGDGAEDDMDGGDVISQLHAPKKVNPDDEAVRYSGLSEGVGRMGVWIKVPLPQYEDMWVLFRTSNKTSVRTHRPLFESSPQLRALDRKQVQVEKAWNDGDKSEEAESALYETLRSALDLRIKEQTDFEKRRAAWVSMFVLDFSDWPNELGPQPTPEEPDSYLVLATELEDLYEWCMGDGYTKALAASAKNS